jgi:flagellar basal body-associated protein FliL
MIRYLLIGVWACVVTAGAAYGTATYLSGAEPEKPITEAFGGIDYVKLEPLSVPVIRDGEVIGYVVTRIVYAIDTATQKKLGVAPDPFIADETFRTVYAKDPVNPRKPEKYDLETLAATIRKNVNARFKAEVVRDVLIQQFDFVDRTQLRDRSTLRKAASAPSE